jgi:hypothetical protein
MHHHHEGSTMSARKAWLKKLASMSKEAWMTAVRPAAMDGTTRVETRRSVYSFEDGICVAVARRDGAEDEAPESTTRVLGMRLVGWMPRDSQELAVSPSWLPGARAILWRPEGPKTGEYALALTSPAFAFVRTASKEVPAPPISERRPRAAVPAYVVPSPPSTTRIEISA